MTAMERARGVVTRRMALDDIREQNTADERSYLRDPAQVVKFYEELRAIAAEVHRKIEEDKHGDGLALHRRSRKLRILYKQVAQRIVEVRPAAKEANRRAHTAVAVTESHVLYSAIRKHRDAHVDNNIEPTAHDMELWAMLERSSAEIAEKA